MKKMSNLKKIVFVFMSVLILTSINIFVHNSHAIAINTENTKLNDIIDVGEDIYVQHNSENQDVYLLNSEGEQTTVYKILNVNYTPSKQWTTDGLYIDDETGKIGATSPDDYIRVKEDEVYFVRLYGIGDIYKGPNGDERHWTTPIVYFDDNGNCVGHALSNTHSASKKGVEITIPEHATRMYISNYYNQSITVQKKIILNEEEFASIKSKQDKIINYVNTNYENLKKDPVIYSELDKAYITFVNDDSRPNVDLFADLFISKNTPLCFAAVVDNLLNTSSNLKESRLDVAKRVQDAGGEILAHNGPVITANTINDNNFMYNYFVVQKQLLTSMGFNVNGIILAGGSGQIVGSDISAKWASAIYKYSDLLGEQYETPFGIDSVYHHRRYSLGSYNNDVEKIKTEIDNAIQNKKWISFYFHDTNEISLETLNEILDYINNKSSEEVQIVTYNTMYKKFATRESSVKEDKKTYYVSSNGTSKDGTDINNPINLETLNNKKIKTGDTILFKSGDTFYGNINPSITQVDDKYVTISYYGDGDLPTISTYKYISNAWEKYSDHIYRINIKDKNNYIGYTNEDANSFNVAFLSDDNGNKYYNKKVSIESLNNKYDFFSDDSTYLYMYIDNNPYIELGNLKVVVRSNILSLSSNMKISNIRFAYTGGHAISGSKENLENIIIENCIIENIGGSYLYGGSLSKDTRYGNGIEFYGTNVSDVVIKNNIIRNIYDVGFTIQGPKGSGNNIYVNNNVFINNSQDSEIWENEKATGVTNYQFSNNLSINQGRGWGYDARPDKDPAASILFWGYEIDNTDISFKNNTLYNPRQIYYLSVPTDNYFLNHDTIKSDNNIYYMSEDTTIYRSNWNYNTRQEFISKYNVDHNSTFSLINPNSYITEQANFLNDINKLRLLVLNKEDVIKSIELINVPKHLKIQKGNTINLKDFSLQINYLDGLNNIINIDNNMLSNIDYNKIGNQTVTVSYLGFTTTFNIEIEEPIKEPVIPEEPVKPVEPTVPEEPTKEIEDPESEEVIVIEIPKKEETTTKISTVKTTTSTKYHKENTIVDNNIEKKTNYAYIIVIVLLIVCILIAIIYVKNKKVSK